METLSAVVLACTLFYNGAYEGEGNFTSFDAQLISFRDVAAAIRKEEGGLNGILSSVCVPAGE